MAMNNRKTLEILNKYDYPDGNQFDYSDESEEGSIDGDEGWQSNTKHLRQRLNQIYYFGAFSDLTVDFEKVSFKVHKLILAMHSPMYEAMFYGSLAHVGDTIEFHDVSEETFKWILSYMYLGSFIILDIKLAMDIYSFAHEKQMNMLVKRCSKFISEKVTIETAIRVLEMGTLYDDEELKSVSTKKIFEKRKSVFASKEIGKMPKKLLIDIVSRDKIFCPEKELFTSIYLWSILQIRKSDHPVNSDTVRKEMDEFFPYISFLLMNSDYFISFVMKTGVLTAEESLAILNCINKQTIKSELPSFVSRSRKERFIQATKLSNYVINLNRIAQCNMSFIYNHTHEEYSDKIIVFRTSEDIFINSIRVKSCCYTGSWRIHVFDIDEKEMGVSTNNNSPYTFERLIPIYANKIYVCVMKGKGKRSKHTVVDFETVVGATTFYGICIACNVSINFTM